MFFIEYITSFISVAFMVAYAFVSAIPLTWAWNRVAEKFFSSYLPDIWINMTFKETWCIIMVTMFIGEAIKRIVPTVVTIKQLVKKGED